MRIDGKEIAEQILKNLKERTEKLKKKGILPHLVIILVGEDPASKAYVRQKEIKTQEISAKVTTYTLPGKTSQKELLSLVDKQNKDSTVHGLIVQIPLPSHINEDLVSEGVDPQKDIDSFNSNSQFKMPLAQAVLKILEEIHTRILLVTLDKEYPCQKESFEKWLKSKNFVVVGKGKTGGKPTIEMLENLGIKPEIIDSKTKDPDAITKNADIIISAVGRPNIITSQMVKRGVILISVGLHKGEDGKLHGDYEEEDIKNKALFYTPTPKGVGPVNVAMLLENLITGAEKFLH